MNARKFLEISARAKQYHQRHGDSQVARDLRDMTYEASRWRKLLIEAQTSCQAIAADPATGPLARSVAQGLNERLSDAIGDRSPTATARS